MAHAHPSARVTTPTGASAEVLPPGSLTFYGHRGAYQATRKAASTCRLVFVGDSMIYGQGVPASQTLGQRCARHLNAARPGLFVESVTLGVPGACLFNALGRAQSHGRRLEPDVLVIVACCNDAYMLRPQPPDYAAIGDSWREFTPIIETALGSFAEAWGSNAGPSIALLYFDRFPVYGDVSAVGILADACRRAGILFIDGSAPLAEYPYEQLQVSIADGHLNAFAHDVVARQVARALLQSGRLPTAPDFGGPQWFEALRPLPSALIDAGVSPPMAVARVLSVLDAKWNDRRNRNRLQVQADYLAMRDTMRDAQRDQLVELGWVAANRLRSARHDGASMLADHEASIYYVNAAAYALDHVVRTGALGQDLSELSSLLGPKPESYDLAVLTAQLTDLRSSADDALARTRGLLAALPVGSSASDIHDLQAYAVRLEQWIAAHVHTLDRVSALLPRLDLGRCPDAAWLLSYMGRTLNALDRALNTTSRVLPWDRTADAIAGLTFNSPWMALGFTVAADAGPDQWSFRVSGDSVAPDWHERYLYAGNFIRDGQPRVYEVEVPVTLLGSIRVQVFGNGFDTREDGTGPLRFYPATLAVPGQPAFTLRQPAHVVHRSSTSIVLEYRDISALECFQPAN